MEFDLTYMMIRFLFTSIFLIVIGTFAVTAVRGIIQWVKNNQSPRLTVPATVLAKRSHVSRHRHAGANGIRHTSTYTSYYVTFQMENGERMEFRMSGQQFGVLIEGDTGNLSFQGTRYLGFERT